MILRGAAANFKRQQALEVVRDIEFVSHPCSAMQLHGLLTDEARRLPDQHLGRRQANGLAKLNPRAAVRNRGRQRTIHRTDDAEQRPTRCMIKLVMHST